MSYAVCVTFTIQSGQMALFMPLMIANTQTSLADEKGCLQFDVLTDPARPDEVFLYELYDDPAAFQVHLTSLHFRSFDAATATMIADKAIKTNTQVAQ
jgi:autoinducer 2-degrading protein